MKKISRFFRICRALFLLRIWPKDEMKKWYTAIMIIVLVIMTIGFVRAYYPENLLANIALILAIVSPFIIAFQVKQKNKTAYTKN